MSEGGAWAIVERGKLADTLIVEATGDKFLEHAPVGLLDHRIETPEVRIVSDIGGQDFDRRLIQPKRGIP